MLNRNKSYQKRYNQTFLHTGTCITPIQPLEKNRVLFRKKIAGLKCVMLMHLSMFFTRRGAAGIPWGLDEQKSFPPEFERTL